MTRRRRRNEISENFDLLTFFNAHSNILLEMIRHRRKKYSMNSHKLAKNVFLLAYKSHLKYVCFGKKEKLVVIVVLEVYFY